MTQENPRVAGERPRPPRSLILSKGWEFLNRPFVVALLGGAFVALLVAHWEEVQRKQAASLAYERAIAAQQIEVMRELPAVYELSASALDHRFTRLLSLAKVTNSIAEERSRTNRDPEVMAELKVMEKEMKKEIRELEIMYVTAEPPDGILRLAESLFRCESVTSAARDLSVAWTEFQDSFLSLVRNWNSQFRLDREQIEAAEEFRAPAVDKLNELLRALQEEMGRETSDGRDGRGCQ